MKVYYGANFLTVDWRASDIKSIYLSEIASHCCCCYDDDDDDDDDDYYMMMMMMMISSSSTSSSISIITSLFFLKNKVQHFHTCHA